ncbi:MAG: transposase [Actinomycetota bacterium]|nr:transposase [Actinomycetota bacterium]
MGRLPEAQLAPHEVRELRELTRYRVKLVRLRTSLKDQVHGVLARLGVTVTCTGIFGKAGTAWLDGLRLPQPYGGKVTSLRHLAGELTTEITMLSEVIASLLAGDRGCQVIQQLPGIGPVLAAVIVAEIGDVTRFGNAGQLCSRAGLTPKHRESDVKVKRGHVTKQGIAAAALGAHRGHPAHPPRLRHRCRQGRHHRPPREGSPQHRQGRRRPPAAHPGLLRDARRADPLPVPAARRAGRHPGGAGRMNTTPMGSGARSPGILPPVRREAASYSAPRRQAGGRPPD